MHLWVTATVLARKESGDWSVKKLSFSREAGEPGDVRASVEESLCFDAEERRRIALQRVPESDLQVTGRGHRRKLGTTVLQELRGKTHVSHASPQIHGLARVLYAKPQPIQRFLDEMGSDWKGKLLSPGTSEAEREGRMQKSTTVHCGRRKQRVGNCELTGCEHETSERPPAFISKAVVETPVCPSGVQSKGQDMALVHAMTASNRHEVLKSHALPVRQHISDGVAVANAVREGLHSPIRHHVIPGQSVQNVVQALLVILSAFLLKLFNDRHLSLRYIAPVHGDVRYTHEALETVGFAVNMVSSVESAVTLLLTDWRKPSAGIQETHAIESATEQTGQSLLVGGRRERFKRGHRGELLVHLLCDAVAKS